MSLKRKQRKSVATIVEPWIPGIEEDETALPFGSRTVAKSHKKSRPSKKETFNDKVTENESNCEVLEQTPGVVKAYVGYTPDDPKRIIYHCITEKANVSENTELGLEVKYKTIDEHNKEDEDMVDIGRKYSLSWKAQKDLKNIIFAEENDLMKKHSNLIDVSAGSCKSVGYGTNHKIKITPCIVLTVKSKGIIPFGETPLPSKIEKYPTDVREAYFYRIVVAGPETFHQNIISGCEIGTQIENLISAGTMGPFVRYRDKGIRGVTCAHVLLDKSELEKVKQNPRSFPLDRVCSQPRPQGRKDNRCGLLTEVKYTEKLDIVLFDIDSARNPTVGHFPSYRNNGIPQGLHYTSGEILEPTTGLTVYKCGKTTGVTKGKVSAINKTTTLDNEKVSGVFKISATEAKAFSEGGDSGSLIFTRSCNNDDIIGVGILVGGNTRTDYAIPLAAVLRSFGNCTPVKFNSDEVQEKVLKKRRL